MAGFQADRVCEEIDSAMSTLRKAMTGIPIRWQDFTRDHDKAAKSIAALLIRITDARSAFTK